MRAVATPPPAPCTSTESPAFSPPWVKSIRYAVSHAVGRQAASSKLSEAGFGTTLPRGTATLSANVPWCRSLSSERRGSKVSSPRPGRVGDHRVDDDLVAVLVEPGRVAPEDHRQGLLAQAHAAQRPEVVVVQRGGLDGHRGPAVGDLGIGSLPHHQAVERGVGGEGLGVDGEHAPTLAAARPAWRSARVRRWSPPQRRRRRRWGRPGGRRVRARCSRRAGPSPTRPAMALAAASFIDSVIAVARASKAPRKMPGNASTLLIWLGKSERPVATTAAWRWATSGWTSGVRVRQPEDDRVVGHRGHDLLRDGAAGDADVDVGADQHVGQGAERPVRSAVSTARARFTGVRSWRCELSTPRRSVTARSVMPAASRMRATATPAAPAPEITTRVYRGVRPVSRSAPSQGRRHHDGGAVLVVVEDRDGQTLLEALLDLEAARGRDVLEVDATEGRRQPHHRLDDLVGVGGVEADRDRVDPAELLEQHRLALHHRHRRGRADVAEAEHGGAVGDDGDGVGHPGVVAHQRRLGRDGLAHLGDPGRVGQRQVVAVLERHGAGDLPSCRPRAGGTRERRRGRRALGVAVMAWRQAFARGCGAWKGPRS